MHVILCLCVYDTNMLVLCLFIAVVLQVSHYVHSQLFGKLLTIFTAVIRYITVF